METLFPIEPEYPPGFLYFPGFLTEEEETRLYEEVVRTELHSFTFHGFEAKRKVASFGYDYNFNSRSLLKGAEIPPGFHGIIQKVAARLAVNEEDFAELLITEYPVGSVINWHRDAPPFGLIAGISLLSDCTFRLRPFEKSMQGRSSIISIPIKRLSLYALAGASRTDWQHSIAAVKEPRYSITLRTLKRD